MGKQYAALNRTFPGRFADAFLFYVDFGLVYSGMRLAIG